MLLKKYVLSTVKVRRDGKDTVVPSTAIVPGDIVIIEPGDIVPADMRIIEQSGLLIDESMITGESVPVQKNTEALAKEPSQLFQATNMASMGGIMVVGGKGVGVVVATAQQTTMNRKPTSPASAATWVFTIFTGGRWRLGATMSRDSATRTRRPLTLPANIANRS